MKQSTKQILRAQRTKRHAIAERDSLKRETEQAKQERDEAVQKMRELETKWDDFCAAYGNSRDEAELRLQNAWKEILEREKELEEKSEFLSQRSDELCKMGEEVLAEQQNVLQGLQTITKKQQHADIEKNKQIERLDQRELELSNREKRLKEIAESSDIRRVRRRFHEYKTQAKNTIETLQQQVNDLTVECNRLMHSFQSLALEKNITKNTLQKLCDRFGVSVDLDVYHGKPYWISHNGFVCIPEGGMVLEFLDEELTVTQEDFAGQEKIDFECFAEFVNAQKMERWRLGLHNEKVTLFARGLYKVLDLELGRYSQSEIDEKASQDKGQDANSSQSLSDAPNSSYESAQEVT